MYSSKRSNFSTIFLLLLAFSAAWTQGATVSKNFNDSGMSLAEQNAANELIDATNEARASRHLQPLHRDSALTKAALHHAQRMVQSGTLSHQLPGEPGLIARVQQAGAHCDTVAENIAEGPTAKRIQDEWMNSSPHRANLLDPRMNAIGVAVIEANGVLYASVDFARETAALQPAQQERQVASLLQSHGLQVAGNGAEARSYCEGESHRTRPLPRLVMKYSTADLGRLPREVEQGIASGSYRRAVVGACQPANRNGFMTYRMVVLLY